MRINRAAIKQNAKLQMRTTKPHACVVTVVYMLIVHILNLLANRIMGVDIDAVYSAIGNPDAMYYLLPQVGFVGCIIAIALRILLIIIGIGFTIYVLNVSRMQKANIATLFDGFNIFLRALWMCILTAVFVFLWSMLFIIPGIIAAYRYRLAVYILIDNPQMSALECIRESKRLMRGRKWELFVLDLSFILWSLLTIIPFVSIYVTPYMEITYANYYLAVAGLEFSGTSCNAAPEENNDENQTPPWES